MRSKFGGETPSCYGEFRLELPYGDYALAMLVWSQQTAKAEQIFAITNGNNKKRHRFGVFFVGSECWARTSDNLINSQVLCQLS